MHLIDGECVEDKNESKKNKKKKKEEEESIIEDLQHLPPIHVKILETKKVCKLRSVSENQFIPVRECNKPIFYPPFHDDHQFSMKSE